MILCIAPLDRIAALGPWLFDIQTVDPNTKEVVKIILKNVIFDSDFDVLIE
jgi:hypothetical protein